MSEPLHSWDEQAFYKYWRSTWDDDPPCYLCSEGRIFRAGAIAALEHAQAIPDSAMMKIGAVSDTERYRKAIYAEAARIRKGE